MFQWTSQAYTKKKHNERVLPLYALHTKNFTKETLQSLPVFFIEILSLILLENSFQFNEKDYLQTHGTTMGMKMAVAFANIFMAKIEKEIHSDRAALSPSFGKGLSMTSYQYGTQAETK